MAIAKRVCTACGEAKKPNIDFYLSRSKLYKFNDARMPICKECLSNLFKELNGHGKSRREFYNEILNVLVLLGGETNSAY